MDPSTSSGRAFLDTMSAFARLAFEAACEIVAPLRCAACDERVPLRTLFCSACASTVVALPPAFRENDAAFVYEGAVATAITTFKYESRSDLSSRLGHALADAALRFSNRVDLVASVPMHPRRLIERGFDQSALLARPVARRLGVPWVRALERTRHTDRQASLDRMNRVSNVKDAFRCRAEPQVANRRVLLVDDVRTTGATLEACKRALHEKGARTVYTLVLAQRDDA